MKAVTYSRVSTSDKGQNPEVQRDELRRFCLARGWEITIEVVDHGFSGGTDQRPGLKQLLTLVRARRVDVVVVTKLDRLARSLRHLVTLLDEFTVLGVQFVSIHDQIDLTTASGRLMLHIIAAFAEFERSLIRERTLLGLAHALRQGKKLGRPRTRDDQAILRLHANGLALREIARQLHTSLGAVQRAIKSSVSNTPPSERSERCS